VKGRGPACCGEGQEGIYLMTEENERGEKEYRKKRRES